MPYLEKKIKTNLFSAPLNEYIYYNNSKDLKKKKNMNLYRHKNFFGALREDAFG